MMRENTAYFKALEIKIDHIDKGAIMKTLQHKLVWIKHLGLILTMATSISAHAFGDQWKEEVLLHDGSKIIVERSQSYGGRHEIGQSPPIKEQTITFAVPGGNKHFFFKSEYSDDIQRANFNLLAMHVLNGTPYLIAEPNLCLSYNKWGRPNPPYVIFKHDGKAWQRIPLQELPKEFKDINLVVSTETHAKRLVGSQLVSVESVRRFNSNLPQPEYKTILREPLAKVQEGCGEMIHDGKGGWHGIGWFNRQPSLEACLNYCKQMKITSAYCPCGQFFEGK